MLHGVHGPFDEPDGNEGARTKHRGDLADEPRYRPADGGASDADANAAGQGATATAAASKGSHHASGKQPAIGSDVVLGRNDATPAAGAAVEHQVDTCKGAGPRDETADGYGYRRYSEKHSARREEDRLSPSGAAAANAVLCKGSDPQIGTPQVGRQHGQQEIRKELCCHQTLDCESDTMVSNV